jgi:uncharacterized protein
MLLNRIGALLALAVCFSFVSLGFSEELVVEPEKQSEATKRLLKLCQDESPDLKVVKSAIRQKANVEAEARVELEMLGRLRVVDKNAIELAAIHTMNPELIQVLLGAGAEVTVSVCYLAARHNSNPEVVHLLLEKCSTPINPAVMLSLFTAACQANSNPAVISLFIDSRGQDPNETDAAKSNMTPFQKACSGNNSLPVIELMIEKGGSLIATRPGGISPVMFAAMMNTVEVTRLLVDKGADLTYRTHKGMTAYLYAAVSSPHPKMFEFLVQSGADANAHEDPELIGGGGNAVDMAAALNKHEGILAAVLVAGTNSPPSTMRGRAALRFLIGSVEPDGVKAFVRSGMQEKQAGRQSPLLLFAQFNENPEVIEKLIECGAGVDSRVLTTNKMFLEIDPMRVKGTTPLMLACHNDLLNKQLASYVQILVDAKADVNLVNDAGHTALMFIATRRAQTVQSGKVIRMLIDAGARPEITDREGRTALQMAEDNPALKRFVLEDVFRRASP